MISSFHIGNFKSYRDAHLPLAPLTLLIGANASGKSNAIEAIRLLSMLADGRRLEDIISDVQSSDEIIRGSSPGFPRDGEGPVVLGCQLESGRWNRLEIEISLHAGGGAEIRDEVVSDTTGREFYRLSSAPMQLGDFKLIARDEPETGSWTTVVSNRAAVFPRLESLASSRPDVAVDKMVFRVGADFRGNLERVRIFDLQPRRMRGYSFEGERVLKEDGSNVSSVLLDLSSDPEMGRAVLEFVVNLPEQPFVIMSFIRTERGDAMVRLMESYGDRLALRDAPVLSDGTLRVLGIAAALFSAKPGSTIIIEEIDNGVHPSRAETLLRNIERVAKERDLRVLLTTHNPALLDRLPTGAIPHVVCAYRDPDEGDSRLVRLEDLPSYPELIARGPLGQLMTRGCWTTSSSTSALRKRRRSRRSAGWKPSRRRWGTRERHLHRRHQRLLQHSPHTQQGPAPRQGDGELTAHVGARDTLLLPLAAIYETGNHVAQNGSGRERRSAAERFVQQVRAAFTGDAPWTPTPMPLPEDFAAWLDSFPDHAMRGIGLGDLSIIRVWERQCDLHRLAASSSGRMTGT